MHTPTDSIESYLRAKDLNRPHLLAMAFAAGAQLDMEVREGGMPFLPFTQGREAIADVLVREFARTCENVYTVCLGAPPADASEHFGCDWMVAMTEKGSRNVRVGCGHYFWHFDPDTRLVQTLRIVIKAMHTLPGAQAALPWPWCPLQRLQEQAPTMDALRHVFDLLARPSAHVMAA